MLLYQYRIKLRTFFTSSNNPCSSSSMFTLSVIDPFCDSDEGALLDVDVEEFEVETRSL